MARNLTSLNSRSVDVGYFQGESTEENGADTAAVAMYQEFGTSRGIPSRPFLRQTMVLNQSDWALHALPEVQAVMMGANPFTVLDTIGIEAVQDVKNEIAKGDFAPNSPATIAHKGHGKVLIDTGRMFAATNHRVN